MKEQIENLLKDRVLEGSITGFSVKSTKRDRKDSLNDLIYTDIIEDRLSMREVGKLKKLLGDREKEKRRNNFVMKGISLENYNDLKKKDLKEVQEWVIKFLKDKVDIECNVEYRWSGRVIIGRASSEEGVAKKRKR